MRYFEFSDGTSNKFWEIRNEGATVEVRFGKIGTTGKSLTKDFDDGAAARKHADKLIAEKLKGGYQPASSSVGSAPKKESFPKANASAKTAIEPKAATPVKVPKAQAPSAEKSVCISGKLPSGKKKGDYAESLAAVGYQLVEDVRPGLTYLVLADPASANAKAEKAKKLGIQILSEEQLVGLSSAFSSSSKGVAKPATEAKGGNVQQKKENAKLSKRDLAIQVKMAEGLNLKSEILVMLDADPELDKDGIFSSSTTPAAVARKRLHFLTETFKPKTRVIAIESANRMASMFSGPFFCSTKYPQPKTKSGTSFFPIVQVDLDWLESLTGRQFGRGLMQLWFDYEDKFSEYLRVIPPHDLNSAELIPFDFNGLREAMAESYLVSEEWQFQDEMKYHEIIALRSEGLTCPKLLLPLEEILGDITEVEDPSHKALLEKVANLESLLSEDWETHFFGQFSPIQMSVEDFFPSHCFMSIEQWGSGNAQIFYTPDRQSEAMRFSFSHCARG